MSGHAAAAERSYAAADTVSVVIPTYNSAHLLPRAIASVLAQTHPVHEILVTDDGSPDNTMAVLAQYGATVRAFSQPNSGAATARNRGIREATGSWIAFLDADDWWLPEKIERQLALAAQRPEAQFIYTDAEVAEPGGKVLGRYLDGRGAVDGWAYERLLSGFFAMPSSVMVRRQLLLDAGLFLETMRRVEDYDLWLRLARLTPFAQLPEALTVYERQPDSVSRNDLGEHQVLVELFRRLLASDMEPEHRATIERRLRACRYAIAWELRKKDPAAALRASLQLLAEHPANPAAWRLAVGSLAMRTGLRAR